MTGFPPGGLKTRDAFAYCGGRTVFETLRREFELRPFFESRRMDRREDIDAAMAKASLLNQPLNPSS